MFQNQPPLQPSILIFFSTLFSGVTAKMELHIDLDEILQIKLLIHLLNKHLLEGFLVETMMDAEQ